MSYHELLAWAKKGIQAEQNRYRGILNAALMTDDNTDNLIFCENQIAELEEKLATLSAFEKIGRR